MDVVGNPPSQPEIWSLAWWGQIAPLVQMVVVLITAFVAVRGLSAWRAQMVGKRKVEIAEQVLVNFYAARDVFQWVRTSSFGAGEGESRKPSEPEPDQVRQMRNVYYIPIERLVREKELFAKLNAQRYEFTAYFGKQNITAFQSITNIHNSIIADAQLLVRIAQYDAALLPVMTARDEMLNRLGWGKAERPDDTDKAIDAAVSKIEQLCRPILEGRR
jgi:hypothetical protein